MKLEKTKKSTESSPPWAISMHDWIRDFNEKTTNTRMIAKLCVWNVSILIFLGLSKSVPSRERRLHSFLSVHLGRRKRPFSLEHYNIIKIGFWFPPQVGRTQIRDSRTSVRRQRRVERLFWILDQILRDCVPAVEENGGKSSWASCWPRARACRWSARRCGRRVGRARPPWRRAQCLKIEKSWQKVQFYFFFTQE